MKTMLNPLSLSQLSRLALLAAVFGASAVSADTPPADYSKDESWLCRSAAGDKAGDLGACDVDLTTTIVAADGSLTKELWSATNEPAYDCFYVYPTVSMDKTPNSDMVAGPEEFSVIKQQFARFGSQCRTYAPLYRQITLTALRANLGGGQAMKIDRSLGFNDVVAAWDYYLENYNQGRGVILVGHSQGSGVLTQLIKEKIEGQPVQDKIISAMLIGTNVQVPKGAVVGGTFKHMALCTEADQTQCIVTYASFRSTVKPPANSLFGRGSETTESACTNPAQLANGKAELHAYLNTQAGVGASSVAPMPWTEKQAELSTPYASVPGLLSAECVSNGQFAYLEVTVHGNPNDPRTDDITGDVKNPDGSVNAGWGLHLVDMNIAMGDLLNLARQQGDAYLAK